MDIRSCVQLVSAIERTEAKKAIKLKIQSNARWINISLNLVRDFNLINKLVTTRGTIAQLTIDQPDHVWSIKNDRVNGPRLLPKILFRLG